MIKSMLIRQWCLLGLFLMFVQNIEAGVVYDDQLKGEEQAIGIYLSWSTNLEENNKSFIIEKAEDGADFEVVGAVGGSGNSENIKTYDFMDLNVRGTFILYRLKQIDNDGTFNYSKSIFINMQMENHFMVAKMSDVMTVDDFEVTFDMMVNSMVEYRVINVQGETIIKENLFAKKGINDIVINMKDSETGTYKLVIKVKDEVEELTFKKIESKDVNNRSIIVKKD